jgi:hypothetical protein
VSSEERRRVRKLADCGRSDAHAWSSRARAISREACDFDRPVDFEHRSAERGRSAGVDGEPAAADSDAVDC